MTVTPNKHFKSHVAAAGKAVALLPPLSVVALAFMSSSDCGDDGLGCAFVDAIQDTNNGIMVGAAVGALVPTALLGASAATGYSNASKCREAHAAHQDWLKASHDGSADQASPRPGAGGATQTAPAGWPQP